MNSETPTPRTWAPVDQHGKEDCERCCWAMMLDLPYEDVPDFLAIYKTTRRDDRQAWLREKFGLSFITVPVQGAAMYLPASAYCIAGVQSPTNHPDGHAVFGKFSGGAWELLHDPHPDRHLSGKVPYDYTFLVSAEPLNLAAQIAAANARIAELEKDAERYLDAIFGMADDSWLQHGEEGMSPLQEAVYKIATEHPEYKRRAAMSAKEKP